MSEHGSHLAAEVAGQPDDWAAVLSRTDEARAALPRPGQRVAVIGCGTSWFIAQAYAALREDLGQGPSDAYTASEHRLGRGYDHVVLISRSGTTTEVLSVLDRVRADGTAHVAFVATAGTPLAERAERTVLLPEVDERSVVQTRFATTTLALLRSSLGQDLAPVIDQARDLLAEDEQRALAALLDAEQITFLGRGWSIGLAHEAALKLRESTQAWAESYPAMDYRHGPISIAGAGRAVWSLGPLPDGLTEQVRATGAHLEHRPIDPMADLVRVHRLCLARARRAGLDPDRPRHLTRSIVLA